MFIRLSDDVMVNSDMIKFIRSEYLDGNEPTTTGYYGVTIYHMGSSLSTKNHISIAPFDTQEKANKYIDELTVELRYDEHGIIDIRRLHPEGASSAKNN